MPPKNTIHHFFNNISSSVKPKHQSLVDFGLNAYSLAPYTSAAGNARKIIPKYASACRKSERLLANQQIGDELNAALLSLVQIKPSSIINVDHTDSDLLTSLIGAVQSRKGRAIPVFVESTYGNNIPSFGSRHSTLRTDGLRQARQEERAKISFSSHITDALRAFIDRLGFTPRFAFDRGFGGTAVISFLYHAGATFYIRLKADRKLDDGTQITRAKELPNNDEAVLLDGMFLRVVRSSKSRRCAEPWCILTNDLTSSRNKIIRIYYHRFEIEEVFKDAKNLFELRRARFNRPNSLKVILLLVFIGFAILFRLSLQKAISTLRESRSNPKHPKKALSWVREIWEIVCLLGWR